MNAYVILYDIHRLHMEICDNMWPLVHYTKEIFKITSLCNLQDMKVKFNSGQCKIISLEMALEPNVSDILFERQ